jgi:hypothetical protein
MQPLISWFINYLTTRYLGGYVLKRHPRKAREDVIALSGNAALLGAGGLGLQPAAVAVTVAVNATVLETAEAATEAVATSAAPVTSTDVIRLAT